MPLHYGVFLIIVFLFFACHNEGDRKTGNKVYNLLPSPISVHFYEMDPHSLKKPKVRLGNPDTLKSFPLRPGKSGLISKEGSSRFDPPDTLPSIPPDVMIPGIESIPFPRVVTASCSVVPAGVPEVVLAKDPGFKDRNPGNFSIYRVLQGLKDANVYNVFQDSKGNLWIATLFGVSKFDGKYFSHYTEAQGLINNIVYKTFEDRDSNIWFATKGGVCKFDGLNFTYFGKESGLEHGWILNIVQDLQGNIWFGDNGSGVVKFDGKKYYFYNETKIFKVGSILRSLRDKNGKLWWGTHQGGIYVFDGKSFKNYGTKQGLGSLIFWALKEDHLGRIWAGSDGGGVFCFDKDIILHYDTSQGLSSNTVISIEEDKEGNMWFGTFGKGITVYNGTSMKYYTDKDGMCNNTALSMLCDKTGSYWIGTQSGLMRYEGGIFTIHSGIGGIGNYNVNCIAADKEGKIYFGTNGGGITIVNQQQNKYEIWNDSSGLFPQIVSHLMTDNKNTLWMGLYGFGLGKANKHEFQLWYDKNFIANNFLSSLFQDSKGRIWIGTFDDGLEYYRDRKFTHYYTEHGMSSNTILQVFEDKKGKLWLATQGGGVMEFDGSKFSILRKKEGLPANVVYAIEEDELGNKWFGTENGLVRFNGKEIWIFKEEHGLCNNSIMSILKDREGNLWFGSHNGLSKLSRRNILSLDEKLANGNHENSCIFYNYLYDDGFLGSYCQRNSVLEDARGQIWWGGDQLMCYHPDGDPPDSAAPFTQIREISIGGVKKDWAEIWKQYCSYSKIDAKKTTVDSSHRNTSIPKNPIRMHGISPWDFLPIGLSLPSDQNSIGFQCIGIHLKDRNHIRYQYFLEGLDDTWGKPVEDNQVQYRNLDPGNYTFCLRTVNRVGTWSPVLRYSFEIRPPWWKTFWFRFISIALLLLTAGFLIWQRERRIKSNRRFLEAEIKKATQRIKQQKEEIELRHKEIQDSIQYAERIQRALLANRDILGDFSSHHFLFFKPKDVVSGDFYWARKISDGKFAFMVADSTGHGVPGAIMSILNIACLDLALLKGCSSPEEILNHTRMSIIDYLKDDGSEEGGKDGMDGCLFIIDKKSSVLHCANANNPLWILRGTTMIEMEADRMPVGKHTLEEKSFALKKFELVVGDTIFAFTDGFSDQFGGPVHKKFKQKQLKELLIQISGLEMEEQGKKIQDAFFAWKGDLEQIDDVCIVGIKY